MIIAVDFDGTLQFSDGTPNLPLLGKLRNAQRNGDILILWTCRHGSRLNAALKFLSDNGFTPNFVNCNPPHVINRLGYDPRKIFADLYIDDKAVN